MKLLDRVRGHLQELDQRRRGKERLAALRAARERGDTPAATQRPRVQAPVSIYFEKDRNVRELGRIRDLLAAKGIVPKLLDIAGDETTLDFVMRTARVEADQLPVVFVVDKPIGGLQALVDADVSGALERAAFPS